MAAAAAAAAPAEHPRTVLPPHCDTVGFLRLEQATLKLMLECDDPQTRMGALGTLISFILAANVTEVYVHDGWRAGVGGALPPSPSYIYICIYILICKHFFLKRLIINFLLKF